MPFAENSYVVWTTGSRAVVIDPGLEPNLILDFLNAQQFQLDAILNTHGHVDHIAGNAAMKQAFPEAPIIIGQGDAIMLTDPSRNLSLPFGMPITSPPADRLVSDGEVLDLLGLRWTVRELPGHSPGHVVFILDQNSPKTVFGGDVLFEGGIGRTDFPGGSTQQLLDGIRTILFELPGTTRVYPGHGPRTTIEHEKAHNPFLTER
jgi:glyoxylase-like metal-dependent hydrolase (beta-lactamase superfamily II)